MRCRSSACVLKAPRHAEGRRSKVKTGSSICMEPDRLRRQNRPCSPQTAGACPPRCLRALTLVRRSRVAHPEGWGSAPALRHRSPGSRVAPVASGSAPYRRLAPFHLAPLSATCRTGLARLFSAANGCFAPTGPPFRGRCSSGPRHRQIPDGYVRSRWGPGSRGVQGGAAPRLRPAQRKILPI